MFFRTLFTALVVVTTTSWFALTVDQACEQSNTVWSSTPLEIPEEMDTAWFDASAEDITIPSWVKSGDILYFAATTDPSSPSPSDPPETRSYEYHCEDGYLESWTGYLSGSKGTFSSYFALQALTWDYSLNLPVMWIRMTEKKYFPGSTLDGMPRYYARVPGTDPSRFSGYHDFTTYSGYKTTVGSLQRRYRVLFGPVRQSVESGEKLEMTAQYTFRNKTRFIQLVIDPVNKTIIRKRK